MDLCKVMWFTIFEIILVHLTYFSKCSEDLQNVRTHARRVHSFSCSYPQPRSFRLHEIAEEKDLLDAEIFPKMTVLHRCDSHSGCCKNTGEVCSPQIIEEVSLTFRVVSTGSKNRFLHIRAANHTHCSCQKEYDLPK